MYIGKPKTKTCLDLVLDITQDCTNQDSRAFKVQKGEFKFSETRLIENYIRPIENHSKSNSIEFKTGPRRKRLGFQSNTSKYKRKTLTTFWRLLEDF